jgi:TRAP-type C4-dicarboxylate transport system substrate-binding protein
MAVLTVYFHRVTVINAALYESLSAELKQVIDLAAAQTEAEQWQRIAGIERTKLLLR